MKQLIFILFAGLLIAFACTHKNKFPKAPKSAQEAKALLLGKTWQLREVGFENPSIGGSKSEKLDIVMASEEKEMDDFTKTSLKKHEGSKFEIEKNGNGKAYLEDFKMYGNQNFDVVKDDGIQLKIKADSAESKAFGMIRGMTISYKILGIGKHRLLLETSNQINGKKVVYMMESPK